MVDFKDKFSAEKYNKWSHSYRVQDDGDGIPTGGDLYFNKQTGKPVPFQYVIENVVDFYKRIDAKAVYFEEKYVAVYNDSQSIFSFRRGTGDQCTYWYNHKIEDDDNFTFYDYSCSPDKSSDWILATKQLFPEEMWNSSEYRGEKVPYLLAVYFAHQPKEKIARLITFLKSAPVPLEDLQAMERTAKARGNIELGKQIREIFESKNPEGNFIKLRINDNWGDSIYLERGSASEKAWKFARSKLTTPKEREGFAKALAYFIDVEIEEGVSKKSLIHFSKDVPKFYAKGIYIPPSIKIAAQDDQASQGEKNSANGWYNGFDDRITMVQWKKGTYSHELGHFLMDLSDDTQGPNETFYIPHNKDGSLIFDPNDCNILESVSKYGGTCNAQRKDDTLKENEDPAETLEWVIQSKDDPSENEYGSDFYYHLLKKVLATTNPRYWDTGRGGSIYQLAQDVYEPFKGHPSVALPPIPPASHTYVDNLKYFNSIKKWMNGFKTQIFEPASVIKKQKIAWMTQLVKGLAPAPGGPQRPNPAMPPWKIVRGIKQ